LGKYYNVIFSYVGKVAHTVNKVKIVGPIPAMAMSFVRIFPTPATIALGGVPTFIKTQNFNRNLLKINAFKLITGIWKAMQQLSAAGYISNIGCCLMANAISARTGKMTFAIATFEVNSVSV
jgi:hypothetical protein